MKEGKKQFIRVLQIFSACKTVKLASAIHSDDAVLCNAVLRGDFLMEKHVVLGTELHSLTGQKTPIKLLGRLDQSCTYDKVRLIKTAQAELIRHLRSLQHPLPLVPASDTGKVLTSWLTVAGFLSRAFNPASTTLSGQ